MSKNIIFFESYFVNVKFFFKVQYSWLWKLANITQNPYSLVWSNETNEPELINGPTRKTMYVTALYFTMTCMTSVSINQILSYIM